MYLRPPAFGPHLGPDAISAQTLGGANMISGRPSLEPVQVLPPGLTIKETLNKSSTVIANTARQPRIHVKPIISGLSRRFVPRAGGFNQRFPDSRNIFGIHPRLSVT